MENNILANILIKEVVTKEDLEFMKIYIRENYYSGATYCMHCPGSIEKLKKDFKNAISKINDQDYGKE